jgi:hypothetical protein
MIEQLNTTIIESNKGGPLESESDDEDELRRTELDIAVFDFCISSIKQKVYKQRYINPLLHFTSILGIGSDSGSWIACYSFTRFLAGFIWCGRVLMLEHLFKGEPLEDESESEYEYDISIRNDRNETAVERFLDGYRTWLADGIYSPMSAIIYWMSFGRGYRKRENRTV